MLESFQFESFEDFYRTYSFESIEPFTLVSFNRVEKKVEEIRWDEIQIHHRIVDADRPQIWSATALYNQAQREERESWFWNMVAQKGELQAKDLVHFHLNSHGQDPYYDIRMERENGVATTSTTQIVVQAGENKLTYVDY